MQVAAAPPPLTIDSLAYGQPATGQQATPGPLLMTARASPRAAVATPVAYVPAAPEGPYTLDSGDRLRIVVFGQDGLTNSYSVDASGRLEQT